MRLTRAHGLGNDYLVLDEGDPLTPERVRALCDRHRGVGGDGILEPTAPGPADHGVRIWNPDGTVAEKSGNGLRIFARWLARRGAGDAFTVWTGHDVVRCEAATEVVTIDMGRARFEAPPGRPLEVDGVLREVIPVDLGNPHCVLFVDRPLDELPWAAWGEALHAHPYFPARTNVQVARVLAADRVALRIFERGAGPTLASGSSACAVVAAAVHTGRLLPGEVRAQMPGGTLHVRVDAGGEVRLRGPVAFVGTFEVDPGWLAAH